MRWLGIMVGLVILWIGSQIGTQNPLNVTSFVEPVKAQVASAQATPAIDWPQNCYRPDAQAQRQEACKALAGAGFSKDQTQIMLAISQGESGLRLDAVGDQSLANAKWSNSRGPFQIRSLKAEWGKGTCRDEQALTNNGWDFHARCAYEISGGGSNYKPWSVFLHGIYKKYL